LVIILIYIQKPAVYHGLANEEQHAGICDRTRSNVASRLNVVGVGIGPFNLSLAALLEPLAALHCRFYERQPAFDWHPGMLLPGARMQTSFLKDLVTPVDPTSRFGFLSYLVGRGQLYRFLNADYPRIQRAEYANYLRWVADQLPSLAFGREVREIGVDGSGFRVRLDNLEHVSSDHLVVAAGLEPHVPAGVEPALGPDCLHSHDYMTAPWSVEGRCVLLVGGGQSSAEIFLDLLSGRRGRAQRVDWLTRRNNLSPLDETPFTNEYFTPNYVQTFHGLPEARRRNIVPQLKLAGDGISPLTLGEIYQRLYELDCLGALGPEYQILPDRELRGLRRGAAGFEVEVHNAFTARDELLHTATVVLATGYRYRLPACLDSLAKRLERDADGSPRLGADYSVSWDGPAGHRLYMQNAGQRSHGIADAQLSLAAWRAAVICNGIAGQAVYRTEALPATLRWRSQRSDEAAHAEDAATSDALSSGRERSLGLPRSSEKTRADSASHWSAEPQPSAAPTTSSTRYS
jgi:lysine N6-hydroxylase